MSKVARNTKKKGQFRIVVFEQTNAEYKYAGACIDFAIVREGNDPAKLLQEVQNASILYLKSIRKAILSDNLLNQTLPRKYLAAFNKALKEKSKKKPIRPILKTPIISEFQSWQNKSLVRA